MLRGKVRMWLLWHTTITSLMIPCRSVGELEVSDLGVVVARVQACRRGCCFRVDSVTSEVETIRWFENLVHANLREAPFVMGNGLAAFNMFMISGLVGSLRPFPVELPHL